jgi:FMN phosphatase YigB (HAD superfamily)
MTNRIKMIVYDVDNTLVQTNGFIEDTLSRVLPGFGLVLPRERMYDILKRNLAFEKIFDELFGTQGPEILVAYRKIAPDLPYSATEGALSFVESSSDRGIHQVILTNRLNLLDKRLIQAGFDPGVFVAKIAPTDTGIKKPDPRVYAEINSLAIKEGIPKSQIVSIGDHVDDYLAARGNGIEFYAILAQGSSSIQDFVHSGLEKEHIVTDFHNLERILYG